MTSKEYMLQVRKFDLLISNKLKEVEHWKSIALSTTTVPDSNRVQVSGSHQKIADAVSIYIDIEREINADIDMLIDCKQEIIKKIEKLPYIEYDILHKVYIQGFDFYAVADSYDKSYSWVTSVHGRALKSLQKILEKEV